MYQNTFVSAHNVSIGHYFKMAHAFHSPSGAHIQRTKLRHKIALPSYVFLFMFNLSVSCFSLSLSLSFSHIFFISIDFKWCGVRRCKTNATASSHRPSNQIYGKCRKKAESKQKLVHGFSRKAHQIDGYACIRNALYCIYLFPSANKRVLRLRHKNKRITCILEHNNNHRKSTSLSQYLVLKFLHSCLRR